LSIVWMKLQSKFKIAFMNLILRSKMPKIYQNLHFLIQFHHEFFEFDSKNDYLDRFADFSMLKMAQTQQCIVICILILILLVSVRIRIPLTETSRIIIKICRFKSERQFGSFNFSKKTIWWNKNRLSSSIITENDSL
jgi:hypothetical protein